MKGILGYILIGAVMGVIIKEATNFSIWVTTALVAVFAVGLVLIEDNQKKEIKTEIIEELEDNSDDFNSQ